MKIRTCVIIEREVDIMIQLQDLYYGSNIDLYDRRNWIGIFGSREATQKELDMAFLFAQKCVSQGKVVVSGGALGVDTAAHKGCLSAGGKTIAILSTEPNTISPPSNKALAEQIKKQGGLIHPFNEKAAEKAPGERGMGQFQKRLIERNILAAHLLPTIVIVKDGADKIIGGTKWVVNYGNELGKRVVRLDSEGIIHQNPDYEKSKIYWDMELNILELVM